MQTKQAPVRSVIFLGRKPGAVKAVRWLLKQKIKINCLVTKEGTAEARELRALALAKKIPFYTDDEKLYARLQKHDPAFARTDLVISYLFWKKIREPLYKLPRLGCVNFHPAPLPDYKSRAGYNIAILEKKSRFGVSAHYIDSEQFDSGPIIKVLRFPMLPDSETVFSLERKTQAKLLELFESVMARMQAGQSFRLKKNRGGLYLTSKQLENLKNIDSTRDSSGLIHRKIRAFFFPPYHGAKIVIKGEEYTLLDEAMLKYLNELISGSKGL